MGGTLRLTVNSFTKPLKPLKNTWRAKNSRRRTPEVRRKGKWVAEEPKHRPMFWKLWWRREANFLESEDSFVVVLPEHDSTLVVLPKKAKVKVEVKVEEEERNELPEEETAVPEAAVVLRSSAANNHKGLARKVLP
ncbi:unnamed protein product [Camellia sinensis]